MEGFKKVRRVIQITCPDCLGVKEQLTPTGRVKCVGCRGRGEVDRVLIEVVHTDDPKGA